MRPNRTQWKFTANAAAFLFVLVAMWYAGSSQQNAAAYLLLFVLVSVAIVSIPHSFSNLFGLTGRAAAIKPAFAGQEAVLPIEITNDSRSNRHGLCVRLSNASVQYERLDEIPAGKAARATLRFQTPVRGGYEVSGISLETTYPVGLLRVCKQLPLTQRYIVYPKPAGDPKLPSGTRASSHARPPQIDVGGGDDFAGVRAYVPGESQRHIDWKAVARGQSLMTKQFTAEVESGLLYLDFNAIRSRHVEDRLSQLALWVIEAERARRPYGLRLPNIKIQPSLGELHFHQCLRTLALFR